MREIKFRAWDKTMKQMCTVDHITFGLGNGTGRLYYTDDNWYEMHISIWNSSNKKNINCFLMQYTGLKDKNGKEIYEGDIVSVKGEYEKDIAKIKYFDNPNGQYENDPAGYYLSYIKSLKGEEIYGEDRYIIPFSNGMMLKYQCEVIGNIYENKELLNT